MKEYEFKQKVLPLSSSLFSLCIKIMGDKDDAKDALQDVFIKLWTSRESLNNIKSIESYAKTITRNYCIDKLRNKKTTISVDSVQLPDDNDDQKSIIQKESERLSLVTAAMKSLSDVQQKIFTMRDLERKSFEEISLEIGLTEETIRVNLSRARKKIREIVTNSICKQKNYEGK